MRAKRNIQYTLRQVPAGVDESLRRRSRETGKSLNQTAVEILAAGLQIKGEAVRRRNLGFLIGSWTEDAAFDDALSSQQAIDPGLWK